MDSVKYELVPITKKFKLLGFTCDYLVKDLQNGRLVPCSAANFIHVLNGGNMRSLQDNYPQWDEE